MAAAGAQRLIVAIDTQDQGRAAALAAALAPHCGLFKFGLEFFAACGPAGVVAMRAPISAVRVSAWQIA